MAIRGLIVLAPLGLSVSLQVSAMETPKEIIDIGNSIVAKEYNLAINKTNDLLDNPNVINGWEVYLPETNKSRFAIQRMLNLPIYLNQEQPQLNEQSSVGDDLVKKGDIIWTL